LTYGPPNGPLNSSFATTVFYSTVTQPAPVSRSIWIQGITLLTGSAKIIGTSFSPSTQAFTVFFAVQQPASPSAVSFSVSYLYVQ
jgi:hypothetical protein